MARGPLVGSCRRAHRTSALAGFTLMELLIVMVIIGILTAIALPNYSEYIARGNRSDAKASLLQVAQWLERRRGEINAYTTVASPTTLPPAMQTSPIGAAAANVKYTIGLAVGAATFTLTAAPAAGGSMATDRCGSFTVDQTSKRQTVIGGTAYDPGSTQYDGCWGR